MSGVPYTFASATSSIPLSQLDANFATNATIGSTLIGLGNTTTTLAGLSNVSTTVTNTSNVASNGSLLLQTNGTTTAVTIDTSQNVGLGVTPSAWYLFKSLQVGCTSVAGYSTGNTLFMSNAYYGSGGYTYINSDYASIYHQTTGQHQWLIAPSGTAGATITTTQAMTLDNSGNLIVPQIYNNTTSNSANTYIGSSGTLQRSSSALKYKTNVRDLPSIDITKFRPVVYNSLCDGDDKTVDHFGFIADEVDQAGYKQLVSYGAQGEVEGFQYERMTAVLTQQVQQLLATVTTLQSQVAALKA